MRRFILAGSILALCACGADETSEAPTEDAGAADAGVTADVSGGPDSAPLEDLTLVEWCRDSNEVWCEWMFGCFSVQDLNRARATFGFTDQGSCEAIAVASCQTRTIAGVNEGRQVFDGAAAAECVETIAGEACADFDALVDAVALNPSECDDVTVGQVAQGDECVTTSDCAADDARCGDEERCTGQLGADAFLNRCTPDNDESADACAGLLCVRIAAGEGEAALPVGELGLLAVRQEQPHLHLVHRRPFAVEHRPREFRALAEGDPQVDLAGIEGAGVAPVLRVADVDVPGLRIRHVRQRE